MANASVMDADLPILLKIFSQLELKDKVRASETCKRWHLLMPLWDGNSTLQIGQLPYAPQFVSNYFYIPSEGISAALQFLLPTIGSELKGISYHHSLNLEMTHSHLDLIIQCCPNLTELDLSGILLGGIEPRRFVQQLRQLTNVKFFSTWDFEFGSDSANVTFVSNLATVMNGWPLERLHLSCFRYLPLFVCPRLIELKLSACRVTNVQLMEICYVSPNLTTLFAEVLVHPELSPISTLAHLIDLRLDNGCASIDEVAIVLRGCPNLVRLYIHAYINTPGLDQLTQLKSLSIGMGDDSIDNLPDDWELPSLKTLSSVFVVPRRDRMTDAGLVKLSAKLPGLQELAIPDKSVSDESIPVLMANCPLLIKLDLTDTNVTGRSLALLGDGTNQLRDIHIRRWHGDVAALWCLCWVRRENGAKTPLKVAMRGHYPSLESHCLVEVITALAEVNITVVQLHYLD